MVILIYFVYRLKFWSFPCDCHYIGLNYLCSIIQLCLTRVKCGCNTQCFNKFTRVINLSW